MLARLLQGVMAFVMMNIADMRVALTAGQIREMREALEKDGSLEKFYLSLQSYGIRDK